MNKKVLLQKIKDEVAHDYGFSDWDQLVECDSDIDDYIDEIANRYAIAMCEEQKKECLKQAEATYHSEVNGTWIDIDEQSILNAKNVAE